MRRIVQPLEGPNASRFRHGLFLYLRRSIVPPCRLCPDHTRSECPRYEADSNTCSIAESYSERALAWIRNHAWIQDSDLSAAIELVQADLALWLCDRELAISPSDQLRKMRGVCLGHKIALLKELGMTPLSRKALGLAVIPEQAPLSVADYLQTAAQGAAQGGAVGKVSTHEASCEAVAGLHCGKCGECEGDNGAKET